MGTVDAVARVSINKSVGDLDEVARVVRGIVCDLNGQMLTFASENAGIGARLMVVSCNNYSNGVLDPAEKCLGRFGCCCLGVGLMLYLPRLGGSGVPNL